MLRITITNTPTEQKWILQGRLIGPWAAELRSSWKKAHSENGGRSCVVDLTEVTFIDATGEKALAEMMKEDAKFIVSGLYATHVINNLQARCKRRSHKAFFLFFVCLLLSATWPRAAILRTRATAEETTARGAIGDRTNQTQERAASIVEGRSVRGGL